MDKRPHVVAPVTVNQKQIKDMMYLVSLNEDDYDTYDPYQVADIIETFIEMVIEAHL